MKKSWLALIVISVLILSSSSAFTTQLIQNGGFDTWDFSGWTVFGAYAPLAFVVPNLIPPHPFLNPVAWLQAPGKGACRMAQGFWIPEGMTQFTIDFNYLPAGPDPFDFAIARLHHPGGAVPIMTWTAGQPSPGWTHAHWSYEFTGPHPDIFLGLEFSAVGGDAPSRCDPIWLFVDDVSVEAVPEPGTLFLLGSGLLGMGVFGAVRRRKK